MCKKLFKLITAAILSAGLLSACSAGGSAPTEAPLPIGNRAVFSPKTQRRGPRFVLVGHAVGITQLADRHFQHLFA